MLQIRLGSKIKALSYFCPPVNIRGLEGWVKWVSEFCQFSLWPNLSYTFASPLLGHLGYQKRHEQGTLRHTTNISVITTSRGKNSRHAVLNIIPLFFLSNSSSLRDIRCVATTPADSNCTSNWVPYTAGEFSNSVRRHFGAFTLTECKTACEFDPRCVEVGCIAGTCWIGTNPNHGHWSHYQLGNYLGRYHLITRCNTTPGQCLQHILAFL